VDLADGKDILTGGLDCVKHGLRGRLAREVVSVFQIAAHEDIVPLEQLYEYCRIARKILVHRTLRHRASHPRRRNPERSEKCASFWYLLLFLLWL